MIYAIATITCIIFWKICDILNKDVEAEEKIERKRKFSIPPEFWDDYNKTMFFIERMGINEVSKVQYMIDDLIIKYHECLDYNTFTERISLLIQKMESKKRGFLLNTQLN